VASSIKIPGVKVRISRTRHTRYTARVMGAHDLPVNDGPELFKRPFVRDLSRAKTLASERLGLPVERITFVVEE
jgi:hypothetical protein